MAKTAPVKYAQRKDSLFLTIDLKDVTEEKIELTADKLTFTGKAMGGDTYSCELEFIKEVDPDHEKSTYKVMPSKVAFLIMKKVEEEEHGDNCCCGKIWTTGNY